MERKKRQCESRWWCNPSTFQPLGLSLNQPISTQYYQFGDSVLQILVDDPDLLEFHNLLYGECAIENVVSSAAICCEVFSMAGLVYLFFSKSAPQNLPEVVLRLLHPVEGEPAWHQIGYPHQAIAVVMKSGLVIDPMSVPNDFLAELLVAVTLAEQSNCVALHAAAIQVGEAGVLLTGPSHAGKTTTSLHLAARGHTLLSDEISALKFNTSELLPFRKSLSLRPGPRPASLTEALCRESSGEVSLEANKIGPYQIGTLFSDQAVASVRLRAVFFLSGRSEKPSIRPFNLTLEDTDQFKFLAANDAVSVSWGVTQLRRALRLVTIQQALSRVPCWMLTLGTPDETACLIEQTMMDT
jgi:hypothetical protein